MTRIDLNLFKKKLLQMKLEQEGMAETLKKSAGTVTLDQSSPHISYNR